MGVGVHIAVAGGDLGDVGIAVQPQPPGVGTCRRRRQIAHKKRSLASLHSAVSSDRQGTGIDPERLAVTLAVLAELHQLDQSHPDFIAVRRATAHMFKAAKKSRRDERRAEIAEADRSVVAATATGAPDRIDDETRGVPLSTSVAAPSAGTLLRSRACYICKTHYTQVDAFYHQLCPDCAQFSHARRDARADLAGRRALLTGGRAKIGMYIALRLLRDGAHTTITTRFPRDAVRRFTQLPDSGDWLHRLRIVGIDLRDPAQVVGLADAVADAGPLDILINNAAQTVRRSPGAYAPLAEAELAPLPDGPLPELLTFGHTNDAHPQALAASVASHPILAAAASSADALTKAAMTAGSTSLDRLAAGTAIDAGGLVPDENHVNSWTQHVQDVEPLEMLEVQLANMTAPFLLISRLRPSMAASPARSTVRSPRWSPAGDRIAFLKASGNGGFLMTAAADTGKLQPPQRPLYADEHYSWAPDGKRIAWVQGRMDVSPVSVSVLTVGEGSQPVATGANAGSVDYADGGRSLVFANSDANGSAYRATPFTLRQGGIYSIEPPAAPHPVFTGSGSYDDVAALWKGAVGFTQSSADQKTKSIQVVKPGAAPHAIADTPSDAPGPQWVGETVAFVGTAGVGTADDRPLLIVTDDNESGTAEEPQRIDVGVDAFAWGD